MKKLLSIILTLSVLLSFAACGSQEPLYESASEQESSISESNAEEPVQDEPKELSGSLTIATDYVGDEFGGTQTLADGFMKKHSGVSITLTSPSSSTGSRPSVEDTENFFTQVGIEIASDSGPDLIFTVSNFYYEWTHSDILLDINDIIANDPSFDMNDYFSEVIKSQEISGKLYAFPTGFDFYFQRIQQNAIDASGIDIRSKSYISYNQLFDIYNAAVASGNVPELKSIDMDSFAGQSFFIDAELATNFDEDSMSATYTSDAFKNYLTVTGEYDGGSGYGGFFANDYMEPFKNSMGMENKSFMVSRYGTFPDNVEYIMNDYVGASEALPEATSEGKVMVTEGACGIIPKASKNTELAWEFIKYCIAESDTVTYTTDIGEWNGDRFSSSGIPINKKNFEKYYKVACEYVPEETLSAYFDKVYAIADMPLERCIPSSRLNSSIVSVLRSYYEGTIDSDACAQQVQDRAEIYFGEIS